MSISNKHSKQSWRSWDICFCLANFTITKSFVTTIFAFGALANSLCPYLFSSLVHFVAYAYPSVMGYQVCSDENVFYMHRLKVMDVQQREPFKCMAVLSKGMVEPKEPLKIFDKVNYNISNMAFMAP